MTAIQILFFFSCNRNSIINIFSSESGLAWTDSEPVNMGLVSLGSVASKTFTLQNHSSYSAVNCLAPTLSDVLNFEIVSSTCTSTMAAGSSCDVLVEAKPQSMGFKDLTLSVTCDLDTITKTPTAGARVNGVVTDLSWSPTTTQNFNAVAVGAQSVSSQIYTLTNAGVAAATGCSAATLTNLTDFIIVDNTCQATTLAAGDSCQVEVKARPQSVGQKNTSVTRTCAQSGIVGTLASRTVVTGEVPLLAWDTTSYNFGDIELGNETDFTFNLNNNAVAADSTSCSAPTLSNTTDFYFGYDHCGTSNLSAGQNCDVKIQAHPQSLGLKTTTLTRTCVVGGIVKTVDNGIQATGVLAPVTSPSLAWSLLTHNFGSVDAGADSTTQVFTLTNSGTGNATTCGLTSLSNATDFTITADTCGLNNISSSGGSCAVTVKANPSSAGLKTATLSRTCTVGGTIATTTDGLTVTGTISLLSADWQQEHGKNTFYVVEVGKTSNELRFMFRNPNGSAFTNCVAPTLDNTTNFSLTNYTCSAGGQAKASLCFVTVVAHPMSAGTHTVNLSRSCDQTAGAVTKTITVEGSQVGSPLLFGEMKDIGNLAAGYMYTCVVPNAGADAGKVKCWGLNDYGQLGDGTTTDRLEPVFVSGLTDVEQITLGYNHACALIGTGVDAGKVKCWGTNFSGQLGDGTTTSSSTPVFVSGLANVRKISAGTFFTCAVLGAGAGVDADKVKCWGDNGQGQLGDGTYSYRLTPVFVSGLTDVEQISLGYIHVCALIGSGVDAGKVKCWGNNNAGIFGNGTTTSSSTPVFVSGLTDAVQVAVGEGHTCALLGAGAGSDAGKVKCWGENGYGQLGDGTTTGRLTPVFVSGLIDVEKIFFGKGRYHSCALLGAGAGADAGKVKCWGVNNNGQLGDGTANDSSLPVFVSGLTNISQLAAGEAHSCALMGSGVDTGQVKCWGSNYKGELGNTLMSSAQSTPVSVAGLLSEQISSKYHSNCKLRKDGKVLCWGYNNYGQLGDSTNVSKGAPVLVSNLNNAVGISMEEEHTCAVINDGSVKCWGYNSSYQLGDGTNTARNSPVTVVGLSGAEAVSVGAGHSCALLNDATVKCWGNLHSSPTTIGSLSGVIKISSTNDTCAVLDTGTVQCWNSSTYTPSAVAGLSGVVDVAVGYSNKCALLSDSTVKCWGSNYSGQLGNGTYTDSPVPVIVTGLTNVVSLAAGHTHVCAVLSDSTVKCWGNNFSGQLLNDVFTRINTPTLISGLTNVASVSAGNGQTCALLNDDKVKCWGNNSSGQLGDQTAAYKSFPYLVSGVNNILAMTTGFRHSCILLADQTVQCWDGNGGYLGNGTDNKSVTPVAVSSLSNVDAISAGGTHTCALLGNATVQCWGANSQGQLGNGNTTSSNVPVAVSGLAANALQISISDSHSCAVLSNGTAQCWGYNFYGQLGNGANIASSIPVTVSGGLTNVIAIESSPQHVCALLGDATVRCWGENSQGQLGNGSTTNSNVPVVVSGLSGVSSIATASGMSCALLSGGTVQCWGAYSGSTTPVTVSGLSGVVSIAGGSTSSSAGKICALMGDETVQCWGDNFNGQLGNGTTVSSSTPTYVLGLNQVSSLSKGSYNQCAIKTNGELYCWGYNEYFQTGFNETYIRNVSGF